MNLPSLPLPPLRVGTPRRHESLSVFPLFASGADDLSYRLAIDALADKSVTVEETSETGAVPELRVENTGDLRVLFLEGEELIGAKQNRILNTSVLVPACSRLKLPVSCVEQGRWSYKTRQFGSGGGHSPSKLRRILKAGVTRSVKSRKGHRSDQGAVWSEIASLQASHGVCSDTSSLTDVFAAYQDRIAEFHARLPYVPEATGLAIGVGKQIVMVDLFDKPITCERVWSRLLSGVVFDALEAAASAESPEQADVEELLAAAKTLAWERVDTVGEGDEYRAVAAEGAQGSALTFSGVLVHGSLAPQP